MLSSISFTALAAALSLTFENATPASARSLTGRLHGRGSDLENSYIVKLKAGINTTSHINSLPFSFSIEDESSPITHFWPEFFVGYSGIFVESDLDAIRASPDVEYVEENGIMRAAAVQTNAAWNLQAISTRVPVGGTDPKAMTYTYTYNDAAGAGVDIYILDTGVFIGHNEFEGRASVGFTAPGLTWGDGFGHGTHIAGIAGGKIYGVAKRANIISVKVLNGAEIGSNADTISGINFVAANVRSTKRPSIACMALNGPHHGGVNDAATVLVDDHVTVVTAAGNDGRNAAGTSPASAAGVIVVGASDITNTIWESSNFGTLVDVFAPGVDITAASNIGPNRFAVGSGTSQATAHVSGVAAYLLSMDPTLTPAPLFDRILNLVTRNAIRGVPAGTTTSFIYNGIVP